MGVVRTKLRGDGVRCASAELQQAAVAGALAGSRSPAELVWLASALLAVARGRVGLFMGKVGSETRA